MGVFDTLHYDCPKCGTRNTEQTKSGRPKMADYDLATLPVEAVSGLNPFRCEHCGATLRVELVARPTFVVTEVVNDVE